MLIHLTPSTFVPASLVLVLGACGGARAGNEMTRAPVAEPSPQPVAASDDGAEPESADDVCTLRNETTEQVTIVAAAIDEIIGTVAPGGQGPANGHFEARTAAGTTVTGFCPAGETVIIVESEGQLTALFEDGSPAQEGASVSAPRATVGHAIIH